MMEWTQEYEDEARVTLGDKPRYLPESLYLTAVLRIVEAREQYAMNVRAAEEAWQAARMMSGSSVGRAPDC
jgi:hypothetical protein